MSDKQEKISEEDLIEIKEFQKSLHLAQLNYKNAQLELDNKILRIYLKYSLSESDTIDVESGTINVSKQRDI